MSCRRATTAAVAVIVVVVNTLREIRRIQVATLERILSNKMEDSTFITIFISLLPLNIHSHHILGHLHQYLLCITRLHSIVNNVLLPMAVVWAGLRYCHHRLPVPR